MEYRKENIKSIRIVLEYEQFSGKHFELSPRMEIKLIHLQLI